MSAAAKTDFDAQLFDGLRVALRKARELGYTVETMDVTASIKNGLCSVYFAPVKQADVITAGGDLAVDVRPQTQEIVQYRRGQ